MFLAAPLLTYAATINVTIKNLNIQKSKLYVGLYNSQKSFPKPGEQFRGKRVNLKNQNTAKLVFNDVPAGAYAISVYQDENNNQKLDTGWFGIPKEPYGFSNNIDRPNFEKSKFYVSKEGSKNISISVIK